MTRHKSFKRLVRSRMAKTGESYTAARRCCSAAEPRRTPPGRRSPPPTRRSGGAPDAAGRSGSTCSTIRGGRALAPRDLALGRRAARDRAARLEAQAVTISYERARGMRPSAQHTTGSPSRRRRPSRARRATVRRVRRGDAAPAVAAGRGTAGPYRHPAEIGTLRLGRRRPGSRDLRRQGPGQEHRRARAHSACRRRARRAQELSGASV